MSSSPNTTSVNDALTRATSNPATTWPRAARGAGNAVVVGLWLWLYRPVFDYLAIIFSREEPLQVARLYKAFFDQPIIDGERETIVRAARSTWSLEQAQANWQTVDDRFQREYEGIGETPPQGAFDVTGVPEPEEWLLIALAAAMLIWYARKTQLVPWRVRIH